MRFILIHIKVSNFLKFVLSYPILTCHIFKSNLTRLIRIFLSFARDIRWLGKYTRRRIILKITGTLHFRPSRKTKVMPLVVQNKNKWTNNWKADRSLLFKTPISFGRARLFLRIPIIRSFYIQYTCSANIWNFQLRKRKLLKLIHTVYLVYNTLNK